MHLNYTRSFNRITMQASPPPPSPPSPPSPVFKRTYHFSIVNLSHASPIYSSSTLRSLLLFIHNDFTFRGTNILNLKQSNQHTENTDTKSQLYFLMAADETFANKIRFWLQSAVGSHSLTFHHHLVWVKAKKTIILTQNLITSKCSKQFSLIFSSKFKTFMLSCNHECINSDIYTSIE